MPMADVDLLVVVVIGLLSGWLAGRVFGGRPFGLVGDLVAGLVGAFVCRWLFIYKFGVAIVGSRVGFNFETGGILWWIDAALTCAVGAILLLWIVRLVKR
jgi:uncharacterized membrane protein YeaQ/YmgE (transglycosylase-associated protein family)